MSKIKTVKGSYIEDITGQTFNRLTVIKQNSDNRWLWKCDCGNYVGELRRDNYGKLNKNDDYLMRKINEATS